MLHLLFKKSFGSLIFSQSLGAFNDNAFKQLVLLLAVSASTTEAIPWMAESQLAVSGGQFWPATLFALPFVLLCSLTGAMADKFSKSTIIKVANFLEIVVMGGALAALALESYPLLLVAVLMMGAQSALFGPSKYGIVKELVDERDMSRANALIQTMTTLSILGGLVLAGVLAQQFGAALWIPGAVYVGLATLGLLASLPIEHQPAKHPERKLNWFFPSAMREQWKVVRQDRNLVVSILGSSFYYFVASLLLLVVNEYGIKTLGLDKDGTSFLLLPVVLGIAGGALLGGKLSGDRVEGGLAPLGLLGMAVATFATQVAPTSVTWIAICLGLLGLSSGIFTLPIRTLVQVLPKNETRGSVLGFSQVLDFIGILIAAPFMALLQGAGVGGGALFVAIGALLVFAFLVSLKYAAHFTVRLFIWTLANTVYRMRVRGGEKIPETGGALLVCNHVSFVDAVLVAAIAGRPVRFLMFRSFFTVPLLGWFARKMEAIPVSSGDTREEKEAALQAAADAAASGELVCIFAEGSITRSGHMMPFATGMERIAREANVPILPVALDRLWGSIFSYKGGRAFFKMPRALPYKVDISIGDPMDSGTSAFQARQRIQELIASQRTERQGRRGSLAWRFLKESRAYASKPALVDSTGTELNFRKLMVGALCMRDILQPYIGTKQNVAVLLPPGAGGALANLALALSGRTSVNLNYTMDNADLAAMCETADVDVVITARRFLKGLDRPSPLALEKTIILEEIRGDITTAKKLKYLAQSFLPGTWLANHHAPKSKNGLAESEEVATVIFSSGSTGTPKGVMLTHSNVLSNVQSVLQVISLGPGDAVLGILPFFHSFGYTVTLWATLLSGSRGVYHANPLEAKVIGQMCGENKVTITIATPTFYQSYLRRCQPEDFANIRVALSGAQKLSQGLSDAWQAKYGSKLMEGYGCTELSPVVSANLPSPDSAPRRARSHKAGSIGRPIPGVAVRIVDQDRYPAEVVEREAGDEGLIVAKGPSVMKGYLGMPDKTAEVLNDGWYTTGDIGYLDSDGFLFITDRISRFSKIGGEMVPHGRVEETLLDLAYELVRTEPGADESESVPEIAVTAVEDERKGEQLVVLYAGLGIEPRELQRRLAESSLPNLFQPKPSAWYEVEEIPKLGTGKMDLRGLKVLAEAVASAPADSGRKPFTLAAAEAAKAAAAKAAAAIGRNRD
jgi:acyl-[acyl-carrier-protein]-phospholipid O-acyltransferase/long-chain-fatty-acid--[acyl-carrier-protein] ligase